MTCVLFSIPYYIRHGYRCHFLFHCTLHALKFIIQNQVNMPANRTIGIWIFKETFDKAESEKQRRAEALGRLNRKKDKPAQTAPAHFHFEKPEKSYDDPALQAEYLYSLIERSVI